jgi:pimeloyl-ACP methyl ester carboxylesterase
MLAAALLASGACSRGFLYRTAAPLPFNQLDYGVTTRTSDSAPRIAYTDTGNGPETIVLIHGLATNAGYFRYNVPALARHYRVIAVDLPGYGRSDKSKEFPYTLTFYAASVARLIEELGIQPAIVGGHSMGGQIAMILALQRPELVSRLVLIDPAGIESFRAGEGEWLRNALTIKGITDVPEDGIRRNLSQNFNEWRAEWEWMVEERVRLAKAPEFAQFANAVVKSVGAMLDEPTSDRLGDIHQPVLIVYGEQDGLIPNPYLHPGRAAGVFEPAAAKFPNARVVAIPGAGHMSHVEQPARVNASIIRFLEQGR